MSSWAEIHTAARLLRVPPERLEGAVTRCVTVSLRVPGRRGHSWTTRWLSAQVGLGLTCHVHTLCPQETPYGPASRSLPLERAIDARCPGGKREP